MKVRPFFLNAGVLRHDRRRSLIFDATGIGPLFASNIQSALQRRVGTNGGLDIRVTSGLVVSQARKCSR